MGLCASKQEVVNTKVTREDQGKPLKHISTKTSEQKESRTTKNHLNSSPASKNKQTETLNSSPINGEAEVFRNKNNTADQEYDAAKGLRSSESVFPSNPNSQQAANGLSSGDGTVLSAVPMITKTDSNNNTPSHKSGHNTSPNDISRYSTMKTAENGVSSLPEQSSTRLMSEKPLAVSYKEKSASTFKISTSNLLKQEPSVKNLSLEKQNSYLKDDGKDKSRLDENYKVLLLGVGESGKSTVLKQFKVLHQGGYSQEELLGMKGVIYKNLLDIGTDLLVARTTYKIPVTNEDLKQYPTIENKESFENVLKMDIADREAYIKDEEDESTNIESLPSVYFAYLAILWNSRATQALIHSKHRKNFHLLANASYFIDRLQIISTEDYIPTVEDVLKCRLRTKGIQESFVKMKDDITLHICDVGGQRVERKKWIYCFSNVSILIFCVSLSDYDRPLKEDPKINALSESIELFDSIVNSKWFVNTQVMLFLNKIDVFLEKLPQSPIRNYFPNYKGADSDAKASVKHILSLLKARNRSSLIIYPHITQATDSSNIELVFAAMAETVMENRIKKSGAI